MRVKTFFRMLRIIATVTLFFFSWSFLPIYVAVAFAAEGKGAAKVRSQELGVRNVTPQPGERFEKALEAIRENIGQAEEKDLKGQDVTTEVAEITAKKVEIETLDVELKKEFATTEKKLKDAGLPKEILDRHAKFVKHYEDNLAELKANLTGIEHSAKGIAFKNAIQKTKAHLEKTKALSKHIPLDPNNLPHRMVKAKARAPRLKKEEFEKDFPIQKKQKTNFTAEVAEKNLTAWYETQKKTAKQKPILVASNGPLTGILSTNSELTNPQPIINAWPSSVPSVVNRFEFTPNSELSTPNYQVAQATVELPTAADLVQTPEVQFTPEIQALAAQLNHNPVKIYEWVRNNIEFVPTYSSIQGAQMTLETKMGNAFDTSSLLIALLRASGISAHYVYGTIELPSDRFMNWVGGFSDIQAAISFVASTGIPIKPLATGGVITKVQLEHPWVEAWIDYNPSRGERHREGDTWIPLDASYKQHRDIAGIDIPGAVSLDEQALLQTLQTGASADEQTGSVTGGTCSAVQQVMENYRILSNNYLGQQHRDATVSDVLGKKTIIKQEFPYLLGTLPYRVSTAGVRASEMPDELRHNVTIRLTNSANGVVTITRSLAETAGKKITLGYAPATQADQDVIKNYLPNQTGTAFDLSSLPASLPAYLINVKPELRIDGSVAATGPATGLGTIDTLTTSFIDPDQNINSVARNITAGDYIVLDISSGSPPVDELNALLAKLEDAAAKLQTGSTGLTREDILGNALHAAALAYSAEQGLKRRVLGPSFKVKSATLPSMLLVSAALDATWSFGLPLKTNAGGTSLDNALDRIVSASLAADHAKEAQYNLIIAMNTSTLAHQVLDGLHGASGISAVRAFQIAKAASIPIHTINQANIATVLPLLTLSADIVSDIQNAVNAGMIVVTTRNTVPVSGKNITPIVIIDPANGTSSYSISEDVNGGLAYPQWSTLSPIMNLAWDNLIPSLTNLSQAALSGPFLAAFQATQNTMHDLPNGVPHAYIGLLTEGLFTGTAAGSLGCYLEASPISPSGPCMASFLGSLCIPDSSDPLGTGNARPVADAGSNRNVMVASAVVLDASASSDPDNDPLTYSWTMTSKPASSAAVLSSATLVGPAFTPDVPGAYTLQLVVSDGRTYSDPVVITITASYETVTVPNLAGKTQAEAEALIIAAHLAVGATTDSPSDTVASGTVLSQDPAPSALVVKGSPVKIILSSGPATDTEKPVLTAVLDRTPAAYAAGDVATLYIEASDNSNNVTVTVTTDGASRTVTPLSTTIDTTGFLPGSVHIIEVKAIDPSNNTTTVSLNLGINDPTNTTDPVAEITSPALDAEVSAPVSVIGTVNSARLLEYTLSYAPKGTNTYTEFRKGIAPITNGILGSFDPSLLKNGIYDIRLLVRDTNGRTYYIETTWRVTGDMKVGNFTVTFTDLSIPMAGLPLTVNRTYDSRDKASRDFGIGWTVDIQNTKLDENRTPGDGWPQTKTGGVFGTYCIQGDTEHYVSVNLPDGRTEEFDVTLTPNCQRLAPLQQTTPGFAARPGTTSTLALKNAKLLLVAGEQLLDPDTVMPFDPTGYILTTQDGTQYDLDQSYGIRTITDPNGNKLTYGNDGVTHSTGTGLRFVRDSKGRIAQVIDPDGNKIMYAYNSKGDLSTVTDQNGSVTTYTYNRSHGLTGIKDPRGITPVRNEYDDAGRLLAHIDSYGKRIEYTHDIAGRQEVVKDRNGNLTVYIYDEKGRVLQKTDSLGHTTAFTYDTVGNKLSETDPLGNISRWTYDGKKNVLTEANIISSQTITTSHTYNTLGKMLTTTDPLGHVTSNTYDAKGNLLTTTDALGKTTTNTYDTKGNMLTTTDALNNTTTYEYDAYGNRTKQTTAAGAITTYIYDSKGNKLSETDPKGNTTTYTYDANNKPLNTTNAEGAVTRYEYDKTGNKISETNPLGIVTWYYYNSANRLVETEYPDGTTTKTVFDNEGNRLASIDQEGRTTSYEYNGSKQIIKTTYEDGSTRQFGYDNAGRQTTVTDALGNVTTKEYDALGRVLASIDPELNSTTFEYDLNGNQVKQTDPNNHATIFAYDEINRLITTTLPGGQVTTVAYDVLGRKTSETDAAGNRIQFDYDAQGNLMKVTDAAGGITRYEYDMNNNRTAIVDARNNRTTFAFDTLNRLASKTMPNGGIETYDYDNAGRQIAKTDAKGRTIQYGYDDNGRLKTRSYPDASTVRFNYTNTGKRLSDTDKRGTTNYAYDNLNRLSSYTYPDGQYISYGYDVTGRIASLSSSLTSSVTYTYYNNGRLKEVKDQQGRTTTYAYDLAGSRTGLAYPNGTTVSYTYNDNNQLTNLSHRNALSEVIASYAYTLGAIGNRTRIDEMNGISRSYQYDKLYRLTREQVVDPAIVHTYQNDFTNDAVGNRLNKTYTAYTQTEVSNDYTYNAADQLITENGVTYAYDLNGNLATKLDSAGTTTYSYDYENRLIGVTKPSGTVSYQYDADGNRVAVSSASVTTKYLVDTNRSLAQVLAEYTPAGTVVASYVFADDLINMNRGGVVFYYHFDGLGSTRLLSDAVGAVTDTYDYDAFGQLVTRNGETQNDFLFTGQQYDANIGFYYLRARYYQPDTGRFTALDPFAGDPYAPASLHKYLYAANNPINRIDPSGKYSLIEVGAIMSMIGVLSSINLGCVESRSPIQVDKIVYNALDDGVMGGLLIKLGAKYKNRIPKYDEYRWVQFVTTNWPLGGMAAGVPYNDPQPPDDSKPFYYTDAELPNFQNKEGYDLLFVDGPRRAKANAIAIGLGTVTWQADLSLVGVSPKGSSSYTKIISIEYGFSINASTGTVTTDSLNIKN